MSTLIKIEPKIGEGIYFPVDVSQILSLKYHRVKYLMNTFWSEYTFGENVVFTDKTGSPEIMILFLKMKSAK